jgi:hypothetical protein
VKKASTEHENNSETEAAKMLDFSSKVKKTSTNLIYIDAKTITRNTTRKTLQIKSRVQKNYLLNGSGLWNTTPD